MSLPTSLSRGLAACHGCGLLARPRANGRSVCPRCGAALHVRRPDSVNRTGALLLAAAALYVPANALPIMTIKTLGQGEPATILGGVEHLIHGGLWGLAALIFIASILVPVLKMVGLGWLAWTAHRRSMWRTHDRTRVYRAIEIVGRWSMIDVFVVAILVGLVQLGALAEIEPGAGATSFALVVVLTMLASESFDPRLMWDATEDNR